MAMPTTRLALPDARRIRSYFQRLPLATRLLIALLTAVYIAQLFFPALESWGALIPKEIGFTSLYRLNTYPLLHTHLLHYTLNIVTLTPLLERFETETGTLPTLLLFTGPFGLLPGLLYTLLETQLFHLNTPALGSSIFVFLLLASESIKQYRSNPYFHFRPLNLQIPTWTSPLFLLVVVGVLVPGTSFLGHCCGLAVGYAWGLGWIRFLAPPDKVVLWIERKGDLLRRVPHWVSVDKSTYGRYGVLPGVNGVGAPTRFGARAGGGAGSPVVGGGSGGAGVNGAAVGPVGSTQRLGP